MHKIIIYVAIGNKIQGIVSSELQDDTVIVLENPSCPTGYVVLGDTCGELKVGIFIFKSNQSLSFTLFESKMKGSYSPQ
jgi:hypothetical protein